MAEGDVLDCVRKFLKDSGYPLEMQVARALARKGFGVEQGRPYVDVNTDGLREMDVLAYSRRPTSLYPGMAWAELRLVVECKRSDKPWLLFTGDDRFNRSEPHFKSLDVLEYQGAKLTDARSADDMPVISHVGEIAFRVSTASQSQRNAAFAAAQQVNSAVLGAKRDLETQQEHGEDPLVVVLVPVVVTDSPLVECRLDHMGEIVPKVVDKGLLLTRLRVEDRLNSVWIVNDQAIEDFVDLARNTVNHMTVHT